MKKTIIGLIAIISCLLYGCGGEPECPLNYVSLARFNFVDSKTHAPVKLTNGPTITGTIGVNGAAETDTVFNQAESYMSVPLSYTDRTTYVIHYTETMRDTIELKHQNIHPDGTGNGRSVVQFHGRMRLAVHKIEACQGGVIQWTFRFAPASV